MCWRTDRYCASGPRRQWRWPAEAPPPKGANGSSAFCCDCGRYSFYCGCCRWSSFCCRPCSSVQRQLLSAAWLPRLYEPPPSGMPWSASARRRLPSGHPYARSSWCSSFLVRTRSSCRRLPPYSR
jgi:hypothetical protein